MSIKLLLTLCAVLYFSASAGAATLRGSDAEKSYDVIPELDYKVWEANVRSARQTYREDESGEDSDEYDEEDDAAIQHQAVIRRQQAYEQTVGDSQEGSDEDTEDNFEEDDDDDSYGRRLRRDAPDVVANNEIEEHPRPNEEVPEQADKQPAEETSSTSTAATTASNPGSPNTSVLILIRDAIKKVTELPNTQLVATSAQQYFQLFEHFLQQTIEQVIGDDDDEDEVESTTVVPEEDKESVTEISDNSSDNVNASESTSDKETSVEQEPPQAQKNPEDINQIRA